MAAPLLDSTGTQTLKSLEKGVQNKTKQHHSTLTVSLHIFLCLRVDVPSSDWREQAEPRPVWERGTEQWCAAVRTGHGGQPASLDNSALCGPCFPSGARPFSSLPEKVPVQAVRSSLTQPGASHDAGSFRALTRQALGLSESRACALAMLVTPGFHRGF